MAFLLAIIVVLSLLDLLLTLIHVTEIGLIEDNPVARFVLATGGPRLLIAAKLASVGFCTGVLFWARRRGFAELAAVFGAVVLVWLTIRWGSYIQVFAGVSASMEELEHHGQGAWVTLAEVPAN
ncbi:MAG: DUF5658 family protein [Phycisphaerales bacterium JB041]